MRRYAIVTSTDWGYLYGAAAMLNGLSRYGNEVDVHLIVTDDVKADYLTNLPDWVTLIPLATLELLQELNSSNSDNRGLPWQVRYARYYVAHSLCSKGYAAISVVDSDCLVVGNIMEPFKIAEAGHLVRIENPLHWSGNPAEVVRATQPPYHCHFSFFNCVEHADIFKEVVNLGLHNPYGDMVNLCRARVGVLSDKDDISILPNHLWCMTKFGQHPVTWVQGADPVLLCGELCERVLSVHGKWFNERFRKKEIVQGIYTERGRINTELFSKVYKWFNENGPVTCIPKEGVLG